MAKYECRFCKYVFDEQTAGESIEDVYSCPVCDADKSYFQKISADEEEKETEEPDEELVFEEDKENLNETGENNEEKPLEEVNEDNVSDEADTEMFFEMKDESDKEENEVNSAFEIADNEEATTENADNSSSEPEKDTENFVLNDSDKNEEANDDIFKVTDAFSDAAKKKEDDDRKLYEEIFGRPYVDENAANDEEKETSNNSEEPEVKDFIDELLTKEKEDETDRGFVIEKRQEFWKKNDNENALSEEKKDNSTFSMNHTGSVFKVIGADTEYEERKEETVEEGSSSNKGLIQTFYTGSPVKSEEEIKAEEESKNKDNNGEFKPFFGSGMGTIQRVLGAPETKADKEEEFVFEEEQNTQDDASNEVEVSTEVFDELSELAEEEIVENTEYDNVNAETTEDTVTETMEETVIETAKDTVTETVNEETTEDADDSSEEIAFETIQDSSIETDEEVEVLDESGDAGTVIDDGFNEDDDDEFFFEEADEDINDDAEEISEAVDSFEEAEEAEEEVNESFEEAENIAEETNESFEENGEQFDEEGAVFLNFDDVPKQEYIVIDDADAEEAFVQEESEMADDEAEELHFDNEEGTSEIQFENEEISSDDEAEELHFDDSDETEDDAEYIDLGQVYMEEKNEENAEAIEEPEETEETMVAYSMLKRDMKYTVLYDNEAKKIFDDYPATEQKVSNGLENIILLPAQCNPLPLDRMAEVETKTTIGALTECPVEVSQPFCFSKLFIWGEHIPNNSRPEEYTNQALVLVKGEEGHIPNLSSKEELKEEVAIAKARFHGTPVGLDLVVGRIEADLEACVYAKADFVILNDVSSRILPYALRRARNYLNRVNSKLEILVCVEALKDARELAKILALGANFVLVERGFDLDMANDMTEALKEICRSTGHTNVHDLNLEDICTIDTDLAMFTDISHV